MTYKEVKSRLPGGKRKWCRWMSCLYLQRYRRTIRIRYGYRFNHTKVMAIWYSSGAFRFAAQEYYPSQRSRINPFLPDGYEIINHRYNQFLHKIGEDDDKAKAFYIRTRDNRNGGRWADSKSWVTITKSGIVKPELGPTLKEIRVALKKEDHARDLPRRRGRYWLRKARGIFRKPCGKNYFQGCKWRRSWPRPTTAWKGDCGCEVYTKKARSLDTVASIMKEENATVRTAKIQIYGIDRFFTDAKAKTINKEAGYELLEINTGKAQQTIDRWGRNRTTENLVLTALRMTCSTTGKVYVNTVPPQMRSVREAINWVYNTTNYLGRVGKQT